MIPKIVHHIAPKNKSDWHKVWHTCFETQTNVFSDCEHMMWDNEEIQELIAEYPQYENLYNWFPDNISRYDLARYLILHKYGGIYIDMDFFIFKNFYNNLKPTVNIVESPCSFLVSFQETEQNSLMASPPQEPFWIGLCDNIKNLCGDEKYKFEMEKIKPRLNNGWIIKATTGPIMLTKFISHSKENVNVLPTNEYSPKMYYEYNNESEHLNIKVDLGKNDTDNLKSVHLSTGHW